MAKKKASPVRRKKPAAKSNKAKASPNYGLLVVVLCVVAGLILYGLYQTNQLTPVVASSSVKQKDPFSKPIKQKSTKKKPSKVSEKPKTNQQKFAAKDIEAKDQMEEKLSTNANLPEYGSSEDFYYTSSFDFAWPAYSDDEQIIEHEFYTLSYNEKNELPKWVAYTLTKKNLELSRFPRKDNFKSDPDIQSGSASPTDYSKSGYDRGHLAPAADFKWTEKGLDDSFYMSNMSPQEPGFNRGIWKKLESKVREWAKADNKVFVVTGPVIGKRPKKIGKNKVAVPKYFFKVILDIEPPEVKAIGFIMENKKSSKDIMDYAVSIDSLEKFTQLDFFPIIPDDVEDKIEARLDKAFWD